MKKITAPDPIVLVDDDGKALPRRPLSFQDWVKLLFNRSDLFQLVDCMAAIDLRTKMNRMEDTVEVNEDELEMLKMLAKRPIGINPMVALQCGPFEIALRDAK